MELGVFCRHHPPQITSGELPAVQLGGSGSRVRVSRAALEEWLTSHTS